MGSRSVTCHPTQVNTPRLNPSQRPVLYLPQCTPAAVLALQNWGCNASKPLWSSRLVIPINLSNFQASKFHHASWVTVQADFWFSISHVFRANQRSNVIHDDNFCCIVPDWGRPAQNWECNCTPCSSVKSPLVYPGGMKGWVDLGDPIHVRETLTILVVQTV